VVFQFFGTVPSEKWEVSKPSKYASTAASDLLIERKFLSPEPDLEI